jgi:hypothetical protein
VKKIIASGIILIGLLLPGRSLAQAKADEKLFQEAKVLLFDEKWKDAQEKLEELLEEHPASALVSQAIFYRAKCLARQPGQLKKALEGYEDYLRQKEENASLAEESETSIIELAYELYSRGERDYLTKIEERLENPDRVIRYYAAHRLSQVKDKAAAARAIPVLKEIIAKERDPDLKDRARIDLLRVSPDALRDVEGEAEEGRPMILKIRIIDKRSKEAKVSINIPWALADLALSALGERERASLRREGYDLDRIVDQLTRFKEKIIKIDGEDATIEIWIDRKP